MRRRLTTIIAPRCRLHLRKTAFPTAVRPAGQRRRRRSDGLTLFEVILTLALSIVVLGMLGMAIGVHLRVADASRTGVAETKTARMVLDRIGDDLRNAIPMTKGSSSSNSGSSSSSSSGSSSGSSGGGGSSTTSTSTNSSDNTNVIPGGAAANGGLNGTSTTLLVAISRLPPFTVEQAMATGNEGSSVLPVSDVRSVAYQMASDDAAGQVSASGMPLKGLLRGEWERASYAWAIQQGKSDDLKNGLRMVSPDVAAIEFSYYDASTTYTEWDSTQMGTLPIAIKVAISLGSGKPASPRVYEKLVFLPNVNSVSEQKAK
jgi:hypothetical protein